MKVALRLRLQSLGHLVEDVGGLVHPAPLLLGRGIDLLKSGPEAQVPAPTASFGGFESPAPT